MDRQKQRAFLYGGNLLLIVGWIAVWLLSYIDQTQYPWAYRVREIAIVFMFVFGGVVIAFTILMQHLNKRRALAEPPPSRQYFDGWYKLRNWLS